MSRELQISSWKDIELHLQMSSYVEISSDINIEGERYREGYIQLEVFSF